MRLTDTAMQAAVFKRQIDEDPNLTGRNETRARNWAAEFGENENKTAKKYNTGAKVLEKYTLSFSRRFRAGAVPDLPANVAGHIWITAGHIAADKAHSLAMFRRRK